MKNEKQIKALLKEAYNSNDVCDKWKNKILEVYPKVKESFSLNKWYKSKEFDMLVFVESITEKGDITGYGFEYGDFLHSNNWMNNSDLIDFILAAEEEVKQALINEAKKRGYKKGSYCAFGEFGTYKRHLETSNIEMHWDYTGYYLVVLNDKGNDVIFRDGKWVDIVQETITKEEAEKQLGKIITC